VVLRISPLVRLLEHEAAVLSLDKKRRQVTLVDPLAPKPRDTRLGVVAPKMFAFDQVYSQDDAQVYYKFYQFSLKILPYLLKCLLYFSTCLNGHPEYYHKWVYFIAHIHVSELLKISRYHGNKCCQIFF
jgi:hypothetical protein